MNPVLGQLRSQVGVHSTSEVVLQKMLLLSLLGGGGDDVIGSYAYGGYVQMASHRILLTACQADLGTCCMPRSDRPEEVLVLWRKGLTFSSGPRKRDLRGLSPSL